MNKQIFIHSKSNYGNVSWYVTDKELAAHVTKLTGKPTVNITNVAALNALGFTVLTWLEGQQIDAMDAMTDNVTIAK